MAGVFEHLCQRVAHPAVVFHQADAQAPRQIRAGGLPGWRHTLTQGQFNGKHGAPVRLRAHADLQAQQCGSLVDNRQTQATAVNPRVVVEPSEGLENDAEFVRRNADAGIPYFDPVPTVMAPAGDQHAAFARVANGVVKQVADNPAQQNGVAAPDQIAVAPAQVQTRVVRPCAVRGKQLVQKLINRKIHAGGDDDAGFEFAHVQQIGEHLTQALDAVLDLVDQLAMLRGHPILQAAKEQCQRKNGLAQVMAGSGQKVRLGLVCLDRLVFGDPQR